MIFAKSPKTLQIITSRMMIEVLEISKCLMDTNMLYDFGKQLRTKILFTNNVV